MKKKKISIIIAVIAIVAFLLSYIISYAKTEVPPLYVSLSRLDTNGVGYGIGDPTNGANDPDNPTSAVIWNVTTHDADNSVSTEQRNLYCIRGNYGATWNQPGGYDTVIPFNLSYNLQPNSDSQIDDIETLLEKIVDNGNDADEVVKELLNPDGYYRELLWILDNAYIEDDADTETGTVSNQKIEFLRKIGIVYDESYQKYIYNPVGDYDYTDTINPEGEYTEENLITDSDIKAVQRAAIWYYTNYMQDTDDAKNTVFNNKLPLRDWITITEDGSEYTHLAVYNKDATEENGELRNEQAMILYNYLIDAAAANASAYTAENNYTLPAGAEVDKTGLPQNGEKYVIETKRSGSDYIVGPIKISRNGTADFGISINVTDQNGEDISYVFTDETGTGLTTETGPIELKDLVGRDGGFYLKVSRANVEKVNVKIDITHEITTKKLWLKGTETETEIKLDQEQPLVEITRTSEQISTEFESEPEEFDLALRKYIVAINGEKLEDLGLPTRVPNIPADNALENGTTATYNHRKDPVVVTDKTEVTYELRIYNEGNHAGYASEIIDQLPKGLMWSTSNPQEPPTIVSKDATGADKNEYTWSFADISNPDESKIKLTINDPATAKTLNPYRNGNLDYETIEIKCQVAQTPDEKEETVLTNVAWISEAYDSDAGKVITNVIGDDRDSEPKTLPTINKADNMSSYIGNPSNPTDLSNSNYFYQGYQDDDDFEKLVIEPVEKIFDLELVKFIAAVSKDAKIDDGEYLTDTKNADGIYERAPKISIVKNQDSEDRRISCDWSPSNKTPVLVEPGDYVLYTIRVYNAGEVDGYASEIKDHLPVGLEFVEPIDENAEYYGIWGVETLENEFGDEYQILSTDELAKGQGKELGAVPTEPNFTANLLKALNPDGAVTDGENRNPDYRDVQVLCKVKDTAQSDSNLVNYAEISEDSGANGLPNDPRDDEDSVPNNLPKEGPHEDDEDLEKLKVRAPGRYDLVLVKQDENGEQLNSTATFEVTINGKVETKTVTGKLTIAQNMPVDAEHLTPDVYVIKETEAPDAYCRFDGIITITVTKTVNADGTGYEKDFSYTVTDSEGNDITNNDDATVYLNDNGNIYVEVKNYEEPDIHKGVKDVENQDSGYNADEVHTWVVESGIPGDVDNYKFYDIIDDIDYRLKFEGIENVSVKVGNTTLVEGTDYRISFVTNATGVQEKTTSGRLTLTFIDEENSIMASNAIKNNAGKTIRVTFNTTFAKDENGNLLAAMGEQIENQAKLEYTNTSSDTKVVKESEKPEVHTGGVTLYKYYLANGERVSLAGAKFGIYASEEDAKNNRNVIMTAESDEKGIVRFIGLQYGGDAQDDENNKQADGTYDYDADTASTKYWVAEIEAPEGYQKHEGTIEVTINKDSYNEDQIAYEVENAKLNFDLALRKFITKVQENEVTTRVPQPKIENEKVTSYEHSKDPLTVHIGDTIIYTIRVYNEGNIDGYASEITDDIPEYLEYLPEESTNVEYMWKMYDANGKETTNAQEASELRTNYLSKENGEDKLLKAFDGATLSYQDVKIAFKVKDPGSNSIIITNHAQISNDSDKDGNDIKDIDSTPGEWNEGEDDQDVENVKVEYFDLALLKFVTKVIVIEDGKETITETGYNGHEEPEPVVKVELHKKKINDVKVKFGYGITITNEGDIPGYAKEITDYVPEGLRFEASDNPNWTDEGNNVISTKQLEKTLLQPGESSTVEVILTWINGPDNLALKTNTAEISEDDNQYDIPDRDSTPDNKKEGEDDIDIAKVILAISTGRGKTYFTLTIGLLTIVGVGILLIKRYVI